MDNLDASKLMTCPLCGGVVIRISPPLIHPWHWKCNACGNDTWYDTNEVIIGKESLCPTCLRYIDDSCRESTIDTLKAYPNCYLKQKEGG